MTDLFTDDRAGKEAQQSLAMVDKLAAMSAIGSEQRCTWDVAAGAIGPGGTNGRYKRQCRNAALIGAQPPLCRIHSRKILMQTARTRTAQQMMSKGQKVPHISRGKKAQDVSDTYMSVPALKEWYSRIGGDCTKYRDMGAKQQDALWDSDANMCRVLNLMK